jgi:predicted nucleotidyltransferase
METNSDIARLRKVLQHHADLELAILFGSLARQAGRRHSDVDLAVSAGSRLSAEARIALIEELASATGRPVDLVDLTQAGEPLLGQILTTGIRLTGQRRNPRSLSDSPSDRTGRLPPLPRPHPRRTEASVDRRVIEQKLETLRYCVNRVVNRVAERCPGDSGALARLVAARL